MDPELVKVVKNFQITGNVLSIERFGNGHINITYHVVTDKDEYTLQQINTHAFKDVDGLMNNIKVVTEHIKSKGQRSLEIIPTIDNKIFYQIDDKCFRLYRFITQATTFESAKGDPSLAGKLGDAFGKFHHLLSDLDSRLVIETIKDFHNTPKRYHNFSASYVASDKNRRTKAEKEIEYIISHRKTYSKIVDAMKKGEVKQHITHNDPKINNILFYEKDREVCAVIDLDTIMPGSFLYDIGDSFRSLFTADNEDNRDTSLLKVDLNLFRLYMTSYLKEMKDDLTKKEIELIPYSIYLLTIECGMRFLTDYLDGNIYFHVKYDEHNLVRSRTQIALADDVLHNLEPLSNIVQEILKTID